VYLEGQNETSNSLSFQHFSAWQGEMFCLGNLFIGLLFADYSHFLDGDDRLS
tara:strand:- start:535 stop:690 length:156 start_codon:yes stop_codon:yes gene_type:complete